MIVLYLFDTTRQKMVNAFHINIQEDITRTKKFIKGYQEENDVTLVRAVLGKTTLAILQPDEDLILPEQYATAKGVL